MAQAPQLAGIREEGRRIVAAAAERDVPLRLTGGVAVSLRCPSAADWGWWRTATANLDQLEDWVGRLPGFEDGKARIPERIAALRRRIADEPKSLRWKARAKVGERVRWYELPEEVEQ